MLQALLKMISVVIGVSILGFLAVVLVRWMGMRQVFQAPPHPWMNQAQWQVLKPGLEEICSGTTLKPTPGWIVMLPIARDIANSNDEWFVPCPKRIPLTDFIKMQSQKDWLFDVKATDTWGLDKLVETIQGLEKDRHFALLANSQKVAVYLRSKAPECLFAADSSILLRFRLFESLWIEPAMEFWPDFVIADAGVAKTLDARGVQELTRRQKRILWDQTRDANATPPFSTQGFVTSSMTTRPE